MAQNKDMKWKDAVIRVLEEHGTAMHYVDIAEQVVGKKYRKAVGATPAATVSTTLNNSIKDEGIDSPFRKVGKGEYILRKVTESATGAELERTDVGDQREDIGLIKAFGMYWQRNSVVWNSKPKLLGVQQKGADLVNFGEQRGIYLLHDGREVVYVGRTTDMGIGSRIGEHTKDRLNGRWDRFSWFGLLSVSEEGSLGSASTNSTRLEDIIVSLEAVLIEGLEPRQNRRRGDLFRAAEYLQWLDPDLVKKREEEVLQGLLKKVRNSSNDKP